MKARLFWCLTLGSIGLLGAGDAPQPLPDLPLRAAAGAPSWSWLGADGEALPWQTEEEALEFLRTARVVAEKSVATGINRTLKVRLQDKQGVVANAAFRSVDRWRDRVKMSGRFYRDFRDSYIFECAAYRLSRLLGIENVPPCERRVLGGEPGTLQLWVENAMSEKGRRDRGLDPPGALYWARQRQLMRLFDSLIYNVDRNQGNMLIGPQWKLWFIDHTRSFLLEKGIQTPTSGGPIIWCERGVWEKLQSLDKPLLRKNLKGLITPRQIAALLTRRDKLVEHLRQLIETKGEGAVLFDWSQADAELGSENLDALANEAVPEEPEDPGV